MHKLHNNNIIIVLLWFTYHFCVVTQNSCQRQKCIFYLFSSNSLRFKKNVNKKNNHNIQQDTVLGALSQDALFKGHWICPLITNTTFSNFHPVSNYQEKRSMQLGPFLFCYCPIYHVTIIIYFFTLSYHVIFCYLFLFLCQPMLHLNVL